MLKTSDGPHHTRVGQGVNDQPRSTLFFNSNYNLETMCDEHAASRAWRKYLAAESKESLEERRIDMTEIMMMTRKEWGSQASMITPLLLELMSVKHGGKKKMFTPASRDISSWVSAVFGLHNSRELSCVSNILFATLHWLVAVQAPIEDFECVFVDAIEGAQESAKLAMFNNPVEEFLIAFERVRKEGNRMGVKGAIHTADKYREDVSPSSIGSSSGWLAFNMHALLHYLRQCGESVPDIKPLEKALKPADASYNAWAACRGECFFVDSAADVTFIGEPAMEEEGRVESRQPAASTRIDPALFTNKAPTLFIKKSEYRNLMKKVQGSPLNLGWRDVTITSQIPAMQGEVYSPYRKIMGADGPFEERPDPFPGVWPGFASFFEEDSLLGYFCGAKNRVNLDEIRFEVKEPLFDELEGEFQPEDMWKPATIAKFFGVGDQRPDPMKVPSIYLERSLWTFEKEDGPLPPTPLEYSTLWLPMGNGPRDLGGYGHGWGGGGRPDTPDDDDDDDENARGGNGDREDDELSSGKPPLPINAKTRVRI